MSHINESRKPGGIGYPVFQDHGWKGRGVSLDNRACIISVRVKDRLFDGSEFGEYVEDVETRGDVACVMYWDRRSDEDRPIGSWSPVFPAIVTPDGETDEPPPSAPAPPPSFTPPGDDRGYTIIDQNGNEQFFPGSPAADEPSPAYDLPPEPPLRGQTYDGGPSKIVPIAKDYEPDKRYEDKDGEDAPWGKVPGGTVMALIGATEESEQAEVLLHADPRLIAAHRGGPPTLSTTVHELTSAGDINASRSAPLHSMMRVVSGAAGALSLGAGSDVLSWNIGRSGQNDAIGGMVTDQGGPRTRHALTSVRDGGPVDAGGMNDPHYLGTDSDGNPINMAHLSTLALFRGHGGDGPLHIRAVDMPTVTESGPWKQRVHCGWDKRLEYQLPRDRPELTFYGKWSWWTEQLIGVENEPPTTPGGGGGDPPPPPTITPGPGGGGPAPIPPPTTPGGGGAGGGGGGAFPGPGSGGGGTGGPATGGGGEGPAGEVPPNLGPIGPGPFPLPGPDAPPPLWPGNPPIPNPADRPGFQHGITLYSGMSQDVSGRDTRASTHMEFQAPVLSGRAPFLAEGAPDLTHDPNPPAAEFRKWRATAPTVWKMHSYGAQEGTGTSADPMAGQAVEPKYNQKPGQSRSEAGTAAGGLVLLPPEVGLTDFAEDYAPEGVTPSATHFVIGPGADIAHGKPDMATGGVISGHIIRGDDGDLVHDRVDGSGSSVEQVRHHSDGNLDITLGDSAGATELAIKDLGGTDVATIDSNGDAEFVTVKTPGGATLTQNYTTASATLDAYTPDDESTAYVGAVDGEAQLIDLNDLRVAYENLRASHESLLAFVNTIANELKAGRIVK